jgi:hypothetical protein
LTRLKEEKTDGEPSVNGFDALPMSNLLAEGSHKCELNLSDLPQWEKAWEEEAKKTCPNRTRR